MIPTFASRLRQLRLDKNLRQEQVTILICVNKTAISTYENNTRQPSFDILVRLATLYRVSTDYLLGMTNIRSLDLSGLSDEEVVAVSELVAIMTKRNEQLNSLL